MSKLLHWLNRHYTAIAIGAILITTVIGVFIQTEDVPMPTVPQTEPSALGAVYEFPDGWQPAMTRPGRNRNGFIWVCTDTATQSQYRDCTPQVYEGEE